MGRIGDPAAQTAVFFHVGRNVVAGFPSPLADPRRRVGADVGTDTTLGIGERTREAGHDIAADMKENRSLGDRIADAAHDAKEDLKGNTGTVRRDVER